ncbi:MAG: hypothetical protein EOO65_04280, partial [Methanosarcinales archaeon]
MCVLTLCTCHACMHGYTPPAARAHARVPVAAAINKNPWSLEEDTILEREQTRIGNRWCEIAKRLPGRSENSVKNRWNSAMRRKIHSLRSTSQKAVTTGAGASAIPTVTSDGEPLLTGLASAHAARKVAELNPQWGIVIAEAALMVGAYSTVEAIGASIPLPPAMLARWRAGVPSAGSSGVLPAAPASSPLSTGTSAVSSSLPSLLSPAGMAM